MSDEVKDTERDKKMSKAYSAATTTLRSAHRDEFNGYYKAELSERGIEWTPPLSDEQKAAKEIEELLSAHPGLREKFLDDLRSQEAALQVGG